MIITILEWLPPMAAAFALGVWVGHCLHLRKG